jgi:uncharacterized membrane protein HdeD (DUF308 family)
LQGAGHENRNDVTSELSEKGVLIMSKTATRVVWAIMGVLLIAAGILCFAHPGATLEWVSAMLGIVMLLSGAADIAIFATTGSLIYGSGWFLLDGILTVLLSVFILCNQVFTAMTLPFILGMWLIFTGISGFVNSFDLRRFGVRGWGWFTAIGAVLAAAGFFSMMDPLAGAITLSVIVGILFILEGVVSIAWSCFAGRFRM